MIYAAELVLELKKNKIKINFPSDYNAKILPHHYTGVKLI